MSRFMQLITGKGSSGQKPNMQEANGNNNPVIEPSRSSTAMTFVDHDVSIDPFETVVPSLLGPEKVSDPEIAEIDIWFIHGLIGSRRKTWTHEKTGVFWPQLLSKDFPKARVVTYSYDADVVKFAKGWGNASTEALRSYGLGLSFAARNEVLNQTPRAIYFIAHSLGGLVMWTAGILFFGIPHQGSHLAKWGSALRKLVPQSVRITNRKVIDALNSDSEVCQILDSNFQKEAKHGKFKDIRLFSFSETQKLPGFSNLVVPEKSAVLKADVKCAIEGYHKSMTRFTGPNDPGYCKVKGQLTYWLLPENTTLVKDMPEWKKNSQSGFNVQGAMASGNYNGPVNSATNLAKRDFFVTQGLNSTTGGAGNQDIEAEHDELSASGSETGLNGNDDVDEEMHVEARSQKISR